MSKLLEYAFERHTSLRHSNAYVGSQMYYVLEAYRAIQEGREPTVIVASVDVNTAPEELVLLFELIESGAVLRIHTCLTEEEIVKKAMRARGTLLALEE